jgi:hypothetical protein
MRNVMGAACALLVVTAAASAFAADQPAKGSAIVIVYKDGHQQSINMTDVARIEFKTAPTATAATPAAAKPVRLSRFVGRWTLGTGQGSGTFYITLDANGNAKKSLGNTHGTWTVVNNEAQISWDDGWRDVIRKVGTKFKKFAYEPGRSLNDEPSNVAEAISRDPI